MLNNFENVLTNEIVWVSMLFWKKKKSKETEKWDSLWDLKIKNSSNKCDISWVGGWSGV